MKTIVKCSKSWITNHDLKSESFEIKTEDPEQLFKNAMADALFLAETQKGKVFFQTGENALYISYLNVPGINLIDTAYKY